MTLSRFSLSSKRHPVVAAWIVLVLLASFVSGLIPPMQSPDEHSHLTRAYMLSRGVALLQTLPADAPSLGTTPAEQALAERMLRHGGRIGGLVDQELLKFCSTYLELARFAQKRLTEPEQRAVDQLAWSGEERFYLLPGTGYYLPVIYLPQALGLAVGRSLDWRIASSYQLARSLTLISSLILLALAWRVLRPNIWVAALLLLPMNVFQLLTPTIDGLSNALALLTISLFLRAAVAQPRLRHGVSWGLAVCLLVLVGSRTHLLPLLALPFFLAYRYRSRRDAWVALGITLLTLAWVLFALKTTNDPRIARAHSTSELLLLYAQQPWAFAQRVWNSLCDPALAEFYQRSFIGILGWLDTPLRADAYLWLWLGLGVCAVLSVAQARLWQYVPERLLLVGLALACAALTFLALLVTWTPHPTEVVQGVQGRYFAIPALLLAYAATRFSPPPGRALRYLSLGVILVFAAASIASWVETVLTRYH